METRALDILFSGVYRLCNVSMALIFFFFPFLFHFQGNKPWVSVPRGKGIRLTIAEERDKRLAAKQASS